MLISILVFVAYVGILFNLVKRVVQLEERCLEKDDTIRFLEREVRGNLAVITRLREELPSRNA